MSPKNAITTFSMKEKQMAIYQLYALFKNIEYTFSGKLTSELMITEGNKQKGRISSAMQNIYPPALIQGLIPGKNIYGMINVVSLTLPLYRPIGFLGSGSI